MSRPGHRQAVLPVGQQPGEEAEEPWDCPDPVNPGEETPPECECTEEDAEQETALLRRTAPA